MKQTALAQPFAAKLVKHWQFSGEKHRETAHVGKRDLLIHEH